VFDTNLIIRDIDKLAALASRPSTKYTLIIPLAVVTELSGLSGTLETARKAYDKIIEMLEGGIVFMYTCKGTRIRKDFESLREEWGEVGSADDVIISICVGIDGVLCTGDGNMRIKAEGMGVSVVEKIGRL
jgi:rRNA-processing protein FCF1